MCWISHGSAFFLLGLGQLYVPQWRFFDAKWKTSWPWATRRQCVMPTGTLARFPHHLEPGKQPKNSACGIHDITHQSSFGVYNYGCWHEMLQVPKACRYPVTFVKANFYNLYGVLGWGARSMIYLLFSQGRKQYCLDLNHSFFQRPTSFLPTLFG